MSEIELKEQIISQVKAIHDEALLHEINQLLKVQTSEIHELSEEEIRGIQAGLDDIKYGRVYTSEQANALIQEWLKR